MIILGDAKGVFPTLKTLVDALVAKHPEWDFKVTNTSRFYSDDFGELKGEPLATNVDVLASTEKLGEIWVEQWGKGRWCYHNSKISRESHRGYGKRTTDIKRAIKEIGGYFAPASLVDRMSEAIDRANTKLNQFANNQRYAFDNVWDRELDKVVQSYVLGDKWGEVLRYVMQDPNTSTWLKNNLQGLPEKFEAKVKSRHMHELFANGKGVLVSIEGDYYHVKRRTSDEVATYNVNTIPAYLRTNIGMLKLMDGEYPATNRGLKVSPTGFIIVDEGEIL